MVDASHNLNLEKKRIKKCVLSYPRKIYNPLYDVAFAKVMLLYHLYKESSVPVLCNRQVFWHWEFIRTKEFELCGFFINFFKNLSNFKKRK